MRSLLLLPTLAWLISATSGAHALTYSKYAEEGPDENAIMATGNIELDEAFRFQTYLSKLPPKPQTSLYINSGGGSVQGSIATTLAHDAPSRPPLAAASTPTTPTPDPARLRRKPVLTLLIIAALLYLAFHAGHAHANYRHGRARGHRGINLYWSSARGPWISIPGPFGTRIGHRL